MGKHNQKNGRNDRNFRISGGAKDFANLTLKKFKKKEGKYYDSKKDVKKAYYSRLVDDLPFAIELVVFNGHRDNEEVKETKNAILTKLVGDDKFIEYLTKLVKNGEDIENIKLMPVVIKEILEAAEKENAALLAADPNAKVYDMTDLVNLTQLTGKKMLKKLKKAGIDEAMAFDIVSVFPTERILERSPIHWIHMLFTVMYEYAKVVKVPFDDIIKTVVGEEYYPMIISFSLLERKRKFGELTDSQRTFYNQVTDWCFKTLEGMNKADIHHVLDRYVATRKRDNNDSDRRYAMTLVSASDYPRIAKTVAKMVSESEENKKYLS